MAPGVAPELCNLAQIWVSRNSLAVSMARILGILTLAVPKLPILNARKLRSQEYEPRVLIFTPQRSL